MFKSFLACLILSSCMLAGSLHAYAQRAEVMMTGGGALNATALGTTNRYSSFAFNGLFGFKAGMLFSNRIGVGLFYERAKFTSQKTVQNGPFAPEVFKIIHADPQNTIGLELYTKVFVTERSYLRFGLLYGYASAERPIEYNSNIYQSSTGSGYSTGVDISYLFPLVRRLSGVVNTGFRYSKVQYGRTFYTGSNDVTTLSVPFTIGLNYKFAGNSGRERLSEEK